MKHTLLFTLTLAAIATLTGCANLPKVVEQLKGDPATVAGSISTVYGTVKFVRSGIVATNATTTVSPDGTLTIKAN